MLEVPKLRNQAGEIAAKLEQKKLSDAGTVIKQVLDLDDERKNIQKNLDDLRSEMNQISKSIGKLMKEGKKDEANEAKQKTGKIKDEIKQLEDKSREVDAELEKTLVILPNVPHESVPVGKNPEDNVVVHEKQFPYDESFKLKPHWDLATDLGIIDWELGVKLTGSGFPVYIGKGARLQRALISFFLDFAGKKGYKEIMPPLVVNEASAYATGQLPDKEGQMYTIERDGLFMIPTAEVPITNLYRGNLLKMDEFPVKLCGYTPCFRREAGSYGADVKGLNRLHQFDKVEIVQLVHPDKSYDVLEEMTQHVEALLDALELTYRRLLLCTGDMTFTSSKTYDLEVFSVGQGRWLEVSSVSNFETYQSNRLKLRFKSENKKNQLAHTLNGSALALPRIMAALLEKYQGENGKIIIPEVLRPYTGFSEI
ncbi:MAG: serine--tRNA ligase [Bacteroidia bacterium]|nr:serine--tRNA ligase [Bacteroidia bacterium]